MVIPLWYDGPNGSLEAYFLNFGTFNPLQWMTCIFLHAGWGHLIGNMIVLWTLGMIVEGKVGTKKFLLIYLGIGIASSAVIQILMIFSTGTALGASCAIFGLLAITMLWAPRNELTIVFFLCIIPFVFDTSVMMFCFVMIAIELFFQIMVVGTTGGAHFMTSELAHLIGAAIGGYIGYRMLIDRRVDCEGFDLITIFKGNEGQKVETVEQEAIKKQKRLEHKEKMKVEAQKAAQFIALYIQHEKPDMAVGRFNAFKSQDPTAQWNFDQLNQVIKLFIKQKKWNEASDAIDVMIELVPDQSDAYRLAQAEIQIERNEKPLFGLRVLRLIDSKTLSEKNMAVFARLEAIAKKMIADGDIEITDRMV